MRLLVAALLIANLAFWAWTQGWLDGVVGISPHGERDPARVQRQVRPQSVRIVAAGELAAARREPAPAMQPSLPAPSTAAAAATATAPAPAAATLPASAAATAADAACFEAGPFTPAEAVAAEAALVRAALPVGSWSDLRIDRPGAWILYLGRFATREQLAQREDELRRQRIAFEPVRHAPDLEPGLSLGSFDDRAKAEQALGALLQRGVRGARVLTVAAPSTMHLLRVEHADAALQAQLTQLRAPALGAGFIRCGRTALAAPR